MSRRVDDRPTGPRRRWAVGVVADPRFGQINETIEKGGPRPPLDDEEIHFFNAMRDFQRLPDHYADLYAQQFPRPPDAGRIGEWTPRYMFDPWVVRQLHQVAPGARTW